MTLPTTLPNLLRSATPGLGRRHGRHDVMTLGLIVLGVCTIGVMAVVAQQLPATAGPLVSEAIVRLGQATVDTLLAHIFGQ